MSRLEGVAVGGFYPLPQHLVPALAAAITRPVPPPRSYGSTGAQVYVDPCAGEGAAIFALVKQLQRGIGASTNADAVYTCELERTRWMHLQAAAERAGGYSWKRNAVCSDAFRLGDGFQGSAGTGFTMLYLNPPYDTDKEHKRLEERWLRRFLPMLVDDGVCAFVVPFYALGASAETLGHYAGEMHCFRLPDDDFRAYKQVVLLVKKCARRFRPESSVMAQARAWGASVDGMPVLGAPGTRGVVSLPLLSYVGIQTDHWKPRVVDVKALEGRFRLWHRAEGGAVLPVEGMVLPDQPERLFRATYPLAMPPKPAHIATAIAAGVFNGSVLTPDDPESALPPLLVKGVFDRDWKKVEDKLNRNHEKVAEVQVQAPQLSVTALDLSVNRYCKLASSLELTGTVDVSKFTTADLLASYGKSLLRALRAACPAVHDPEDPAQAFPLPQLTRTLFKAQEHVTRAAVRLLGGPYPEGRLTYRERAAQRGRCAWVLGEVGSGKSTVALATAAAVKARSVLIVCPPHLLDGWRDQVQACLPWAKVHVLANIDDVEAFAARPSRRLPPEHLGRPGPYDVAILSREAAKLGHAWESMARCSKCGAPPSEKKDPATHRLRCTARSMDATNTDSKIALMLARDLSQYTCTDTIISLLPPSTAARVAARMTKTEAWSGEELRRMKAKYPNPGRHWEGIADAVRTLDSLANRGEWEEGRPCGEPLYGGIPVPTRRAPLAKYIAKNHPRLCDLLILDEVQDYASADSAQTHAASRLQTLGWPTLRLTGTVMNGYAASLFAGLWESSKAFRVEFERDGMAPFVERYGYRKRVLEMKSKSGNLVPFGKLTDARESTRLSGYAPGVLPTLMLRYVLQLAVTLHKSELDADVPPCTEYPVRVQPEALQRSEFLHMAEALVAQIKADKFTDRQGLLFGQMSELPSYLDRCTLDTGNGNGDEYLVCYPESVGADVVTSGSLYDPGEILPKERWMIDQVRAELAEGRRCMVLGWHIELLPRLQRLLQAALGERVAFLDAGKVDAKKRQAWIDQVVIQPGVRVLVVNPLAVQTGLNNLVHFASQVWMENPACNPTIYRQAVGRVDRIGQRLPTRVFFPVYEGTLQQGVHTLLLKKVAVAMATDGLDPRGALQAAGVGETDTQLGMSLGRQLFALAEQDALVLGGGGRELQSHAPAPDWKVVVRVRAPQEAAPPVPLPSPAPPAAPAPASAVVAAPVPTPAPQAAPPAPPAAAAPAPKPAPSPPAAPDKPAAARVDPARPMTQLSLF